MLYYEDWNYGNGMRNIMFLTLFTAQYLERVNSETRMIDFLA